MAAQLLQSNPEKVLALLKYASTFPDFPKNFTIPALSNPNYVPPNNSRPLEILCFVMAVISTVTVVLRLWIRKRVTGMVFGADDWLIIPGQILALGTITIMILLVRKGGAGMHIYDISYQQIKILQLLEFIGVLLYFTAICLIRLSITAFLYRLIGVASKIKRILLHFTVAFLIIEFVIQVFAYVFSCKPISAAWDMDVRLAGFTSLNLPLEIFILTVVYLLTDVWLLILPIHTIWTLQLPLRTRIGVTWVFAFGGVACAGAVLKTVYVYPVFHSYDPSWNGVGFQIGAVIEIGFGVISSSMPALNHILVKTLPQSIDSWFSGTIVSRWFGSGNRKSKPSTKSFQDVFSRRIQARGTHIAEAYDDAPKMGEFDFGWDAEGKGSNAPWEMQGQAKAEQPSIGLPIISLRGISETHSALTDSSESSLPLNEATQKSWLQNSTQ